jgi:hypothetical protein
MSGSLARVSRSGHVALRRSAISHRLCGDGRDQEIQKKPQVRACVPHIRLLQGFMGLIDLFSTVGSIEEMRIAPLTLTLLFALTTNLFRVVAHTVGAPDQGLEAALLAGGITALLYLDCSALVLVLFLTCTLVLLPLDHCPDVGAVNKRRSTLFVLLYRQGTRRLALCGGVTHFCRVNVYSLCLCVAYDHS